MVFFATTNPYKKGEEAQRNFLKIWFYRFVKHSWKLVKIFGYRG
jgi:hypothetical protein